jgi:signal transduction histidine kinase
MQRPPIARLFSEIRRPLLAALRRLNPRAREIDAAWQTLLDGLGLSQAARKKLAGLNLLSLIRKFGPAGFDAYRRLLERRGEELSRLGVSEEHALGALLLSLQACTRYFAGRNRNGAALALGIFCCGSQLFLASGYAARQAEDRRVLEARAIAAEQRLRSLSTQISDVYEQERRRLAHDLHDEIGHDLVVLKLYTELLARDIGKQEPRRLRQKLKEAVNLVSRALQEVRRITFELGPAIWDELGFVPAIRLYARQFASRTGIKVQLRTARLRRRLPSSYETALHRVLQGALSNVAEHSRARNVKITLSGTKRFLVLKIEDDGIGFDVEKKFRAAPHRAFGLRAMRERIELLGGTFEIESRAAKRGSRRHGTAITAEIPLPP